MVAAPKVGERFTEFYVLGDYPEELALGEEATVTLGITNHEGQETSYYIEVMIDGVKNGEVGPLILADEEEWEQEVSALSLTRLAMTRKWNSCSIKMEKASPVRRFTSLSTWRDDKRTAVALFAATYAIQHLWSHILEDLYVGNPLVP